MLRVYRPWPLPIEALKALTANANKAGQRDGCDQKPIRPTPLTPRQLKELTHATLVNVYVGSRPNLDLVFAVSKGLLSHYSTVLRQQLVMDQAKVIILELSDKRAVSWVLRWMIAGGIDKTLTPPETLQDDGATMELLLNRLLVVDQLRITQLCEELSGKLKEHFLKISITRTQIRWAYSHQLALTPNGLRSTIVEEILNSVLDNDLPYRFDTFMTEPQLYHDMVTKVDTPETVKRIGAIQRTWPLSVEQILFVYEFCVYQGHLRKTIAHGLLKLIYADQVGDPEVYRRFGRENNEFEEDMVAAKETIQRAADHAAYVERKARREAKAVQAKAAVRKRHQNSNVTSAQQGGGNGRVVKTSGAKGGIGLKESGVIKAEPAPAKPAQRLQSDAIWRLDMSGLMIRER